MKAHIGVDDESGLVHRAECTAANEADIGQAYKLLHGKEDTVCGDSGYTGLEKREEMKNKRKLRHLNAEKPSKVRAIRNKRERRYAERWEHLKAALRAKVEHPFRVIKRQFGYGKVRYRGLAKNTAQVLTLFALSNLWTVRKRLLATAGKGACDQGNPPEMRRKRRESGRLDRELRESCCILHSRSRCSDLP